MCIGSHQAEGRNTTFIMGHALLKKAILHLKRANGRFILQGTVHLLAIPQIFIQKLHKREWVQWAPKQHMI